MSKFERKLKVLLKKERSFLDKTGELLADVVCDRAWKLDHSLIELLLDDNEVRDKFFDRIRNELVFNNNTFVDYLRDKNFLDNSYTRFRNKIGLNIDGKFLRERGEVSLVWPYKDCVLEGGQTTDEQKREEIFFNEILAHDEINRLLDPKVLANWKRHTADGTKKVQEIKRDEVGTIRENMLIKGNNLIALHSLVEQFRGKVKLIYIDPPYNTGKDSFGYNNRFNHACWLTFMRNRLEIARELLRNDGSIWINIDDDEGHYLKVLCDDTFGRENFVTNVVWEKKYSRQNDARYFSDNHDHIFVYARQKESWPLNPLERSDAMDKKYKNVDNDPRGRWRPTQLDAKNSSPQCNYPIITPSGREVFPPKGRSWSVTKQKLQKLINNNRIWFGKKGNNVPSVKSFLSEVKQGVIPNTIWPYEEVGHNQEARRETDRVLENEIYKTPKPERLLSQIIHIATKENDIILDFFAGSGTTAAVAHKMNRQWIAVEQMDYVDTVTVERLNKVIAGEQGGISKSVNWQGGGDFLRCELMPYAQTYVDRIQQARSSRELDKLWQEISRSTFLNWYINNKDPAEARKTFAEINDPDKQRHLLMDLIDKNQLYVHYSEMDDTDYKVSDYDKRLNRLFYEG